MYKIGISIIIEYSEMLHGIVLFYESKVQSNILNFDLVQNRFYISDTEKLKQTAFIFGSTD